VPVRLLRPGYRHLRLKNMLNVPLDYATMFIYSKMEEEEFISVDDDLIMAPHSPSPVTAPNDVLNDFIVFLCSYLQKIFFSQKTGAIQKKQIYIMKIFGIYPDDVSVNVHVQSSATVEEVISMVGPYSATFLPV